MKVSLDWLREYAVLDAPIATLVRSLVDTGTEVDGVQRGPSGVVVARVVHLEPVPESTRGVLFADIDVGASEPVRVLSGAPNLATGDLVPYAPPGTLLPGWDEPLGVRAMFGGKYHSPGMLCSAAELGLGEDASGIHHLDSGAPGQPLQDVVALDTVLDLDVTTNRPDCLGHVGIARELAAALGETLREPDTTVPEELQSAATVAPRAEVVVEDAAGCPRFCVRVIENVAVAPSPGWLQRRLRTVGLRPINNVVDVTNYVAHELGQPLHAFDHERFLAAQGGGRTAQVVVRRGRDERVLCLDGVERSVGRDDIAVCAGDTAVSVAGVIGGQGTAVDDATRTVLLEAATWDGPAVRATSKRLGVRTDASTLNEKGLSDALPPLAVDRAAALIARLGGGHVLQDRVDVRARPLPEAPPIAVTGATLSRLLGYTVDASEAATVLARLGFGVEQDGDSLTVAVPHFRRDVTIVEDVVEEVGRSLGYDRVPATLPGRRVPVTSLAAETPLEDQVKDLMLGAGFDEAITWSFVSAAQAARVAGLGAGRRPVRLRNPLSEEMSQMRTSLLGGLAHAAANNVRRGSDDVRLFEMGRAFWEGDRRVAAAGSTNDGADDRLPPLPGEPLLLAAVASAADAEAAGERVRELQAVVRRLGADLGAGPVESVPAPVAGLRSGRSGRLWAGGHDVGIIGELEPSVTAGLDLRRLAVVEVRLDALVPAERPPRRYRSPPRFPAVVQDLAVTVPEAAFAGEALRAVRDAGGSLLDDVTLFDEYRGVGDGRKGWTFRLSFRAPDRTLTSDEARALQDAIAVGLRARCDAEVRR